FIAFLRVSYYTSIFTVFGLPHDLPFLERSQFLKAVAEDRLPSNFDEAEVELFYEITTSNSLAKKTRINFETFCHFFHMHRLFNKYSINQPMLLNKDELFELLDDPLTPIKIGLGVDNAYGKFEQKEYQEASLVLQRLRPNERN